MKNYKKILEGVVNIINTTEKSDIAFVNICTYIAENCPELKKNDEKIRKALIDMLHDTIGDSFWIDYNVHKEDAISWLEKQGEQNLSDKVETKFHVNEWVVTAITGVVQIKAVNNDHYTIDSGMEFNMAYADKYWHKWIIKDAKSGDILADKYNNIGIFKKCKGICWHSYIYLGCDGGLRGFGIGGSHEQTDTYPATKKQRNLLFQKIKEEGYEWDFNRKNLILLMEE